MRTAIRRLARGVGAGVLGVVCGGLAGCGSPEPSQPGSPRVAESPSSAPETAPAANDSAASDVPPGAQAASPEMSEIRPSSAGGAASTGSETGEPAAASPASAEASWRTWAASLAGDDVVAREAAAAALERAAATDSQPLWELLEDTAPEVRRGAIYYWLDRFDPADPRAVAALQRRLTDPDPAVRAIALSAARRFPPQALQEALPPLSRVLADRQGNAETRAAAARLIGTLDAQGRDAAAALAQAAAEDPEPSVRAACLLALCRVALADQAVAVLRQALRQDEHANVRGVAAVRLGKLRSASADLAAALADAEESVRRKAADALVELGPAAVTSTAAQLESADVGVRRLAVFVLGQLGADAQDAVAALRQRLQDPDSEVRQLAALAIRRIEQAAR